MATWEASLADARQRHYLEAVATATAEDLADEGRLAAIAEAAGLSPAEARERFAPR